MSIKSISKKEIKYVPYYGKNRDSDDPLWVIITPLSRAEADKYSQATTFSAKKGFKNAWDSNIQEIQKRQFVNNVKEVHRFIDGETGDEITDIRRFYDESPFDLVDEILGVLLDISQIEEDERKNSLSQSDGVSKIGVGTVKTAAKK